MLNMKHNIMLSPTHLLKLTHISTITLENLQQRGILIKLKKLPSQSQKRADAEFMNTDLFS